VIDAAVIGDAALLCVIWNFMSNSILMVMLPNKTPGCKKLTCILVCAWEVECVSWTCADSKMPGVIAFDE
jgi:hypothetical protein